jgi:hypothetical protein
VSQTFAANAGLIQFPATVHGPKGKLTVNLALDTGASRSVLSKEVLTIIGYEPAAATDMISVTTGSGTISVPKVSVLKFESLAMRDRISPCWLILCQAAVIWTACWGWISCVATA